MADILFDILDITLEYSENCLHLSVDTPRYPSKNQTNLLPGKYVMYHGTPKDNPNGKNVLFSGQTSGQKRIAQRLFHPP